MADLKPGKLDHIGNTITDQIGWLLLIGITLGAIIQVILFQTATPPSCPNTSQHQEQAT